jgi:hypothetical protein
LKIDEEMITLIEKGHFQFGGLSEPSLAVGILNSLEYFGKPQKL